jgi:hypothetical protein
MNGSSFSILDESSQTLNDCFVNTLLLTPVYLIFSALNGFLIGASNDLSRNFRNISFALLRWITSLLLLTILIELFTKYFININGNEIYLGKNQDKFLAEMITDMYKCASFFLHSIYVFNKNVIGYFSKRHLFSFLLVFFANIVHLINQYTSLKPNELAKLTGDYQSVQFILLCFFCFLLLIYLIVAMFSYRSMSDISISLNIQEENNRLNGFESFNNVNKCIKFDDDDENKRYILNLKGYFFNKYEPEEDAASYISYLTFGWLQPLLTKGLSCFKRTIML